MRLPSRPRRRAFTLLLSFALAVACADASTNPAGVLYLTFESLPFPSVVRGDTLRDTSGTVASLSAKAYDDDGGLLANAPVRYYALDDTGSALSVDSVSGIVVADGDKLRSVRLVASVAGLQSLPLTLVVSKRPDSLDSEIASDTIEYSFTDTTANFSELLAVTLLHNDSTSFYSGVGNYVVRYYLEEPGDTVSAALVNDQNRRPSRDPSGKAFIDTTGADGTASRKLRIAPGPPLLTPLDSVVVMVEARYKGLQVAGSPRRIVVYVRPRS